MNDDFNETYALIRTTEKLKWCFIGFAAGVFVPLVWVWVAT